MLCGVLLHAPVKHKFILWFHIQFFIILTAKRVSVCAIITIVVSCYSVQPCYPLSILFIASYSWAENFVAMIACKTFRRANRFCCWRCARARCTPCALECSEMTHKFYFLRSLPIAVVFVQWKMCCDCVGMRVVRAAVSVRCIRIYVYFIINERFVWALVFTLNFKWH